LEQNSDQRQQPTCKYSAIYWERRKARMMSPDTKLVRIPFRELKGKLSEPETNERVAPALRNRRHWLVVSYDIVEDRRRTKVMKTLEGYGHRVQYSVFECELRPADLAKLKERLKNLIQPEEDDVRLYDLCENCKAKVTMLGKAKQYRQAWSLIV
jgi:CRISPR-associated protein Cas2